jgi:hypothetical protein
MTVEDLRDELAEIVGGWITENKAELEDGGTGDVVSLSLQIEHLWRKPKALA